MPPSHLYKYKAVFKAAFVLRKPSANTMDKTVSQLQLYQYFLGFFLPKGILDFFEPVWMETQSLDSRESKKDILYTGTLYMYLDEHDNSTDQMQALRIVSNGKMQVSRISCGGLD